MTVTHATNKGPRRRGHSQDNTEYGRRCIGRVDQVTPYFNRRVSEYGVDGGRADGLGIPGRGPIETATSRRYGTAYVVRPQHFG